MSFYPQIIPNRRGLLSSAHEKKVLYWHHWFHEELLLYTLPLHKMLFIAEKGSDY